MSRPTTSAHKAMKGYSGMYILKATVERAGRLEREAVARAVKGLKLNTDCSPEC